MRPARTVADLLANSRRINIIIHQKPDGDAIGSAAALFESLRRSKDVTVSCVTAAPDVFTNIVQGLPLSHTLQADADLYVILDCPENHRTGFSRQITQLIRNKKSVLLIDHHPTGDLQKIVPVIYHDTDKAATAELIYNLLKELRLPITPSIATSILLGIYTDTGGFRHKTTSSATLQLASKLIREGGNLQLISQAFCQQLSRPKQRLWGKILSEIQISKLGVVTARISRQHLIEANSSPEDISGLASLLALTEESRAALVLVETEEGWHGMLRTRHASVDLGKLARLLGGSGHKKAAGFSATNRVFSGRIKND